MTTEQIDAMVFKDQAGEYFVMPQAVLERGRVPVEAKAAIGARFPALQAIGANDRDVQGHVAPIVVDVAISVGALIVGFGVTRSLLSGDPLGPVVQRAIDQYQSRQ